MSRKRASPTEDDDPEDNDEEMQEQVDNNSDDDDDTEPEAIEHYGEVPFLDSFYGLASASPVERAQAAHMMLNHCLLGPNANSKDAAYAFRRLLNGLCSGRAAARQGYASALTSFVKIAIQSGALKEIQESEGSGGTPVLTFLRSELVKTTDPSKPDGGYGKKKGSEERDHHFGRLFGILSVIRSGVLLPKDDQSNLEELKEVASSFANDLIELYNHRKWMREPTAFAIITLLDTYYDLSPQSEAVAVVKHLVSQVVVPAMFAEFEVADLSAEQIAIAVNIQSQGDVHKMKRPTKLGDDILTKENVPLMSKALGATSKVAYPRAHVVWDVIWSNLTTPKEQKRTKGEPVIRVLRESGSKGIIAAIVEYVIQESLLGVEGESGGNSGKNATHERRALALSLMKVLCGSDTVTSKTGRFRLLVPVAMHEKNILTPVVIQKLFIDVICAGGGKQSGHLLKPMALGVLDSIAQGSMSDESDLTRRQNIAKSFLRCDPRFDGRTKSAVCTSLLFLDGQGLEEAKDEMISMWENYVSFLIQRITDSIKASAKDEASSMYETIGYVDLLFSASKKFTRLTLDDKYEEFKARTNQLILAFFFVGAFFDCSSYSHDSKSKSPAVKAAGFHAKISGGCPHSLRIILSSRFYSLLADSAVVQSKTQEPASNKSKEVRLFETLCQCTDGWTKIEAKGCKRFGISQSTDPEMIADDVIAGIVSKQQKAARGADSNPIGKVRLGCASLSTALQLHLLRCGNSDSPEVEDEIEMDDEDDDESDIKEFISDLATAQHNLTKTADGEDKNPLLGFAEICAAILSSQFGGGSESRGASPKLLRETVKSAWYSSVLLCAERKAEPSLLDESVLNLLLSSIGAAEHVGEDDESDDESDSDDEMDDDNAVFAEAAAAGLDMSDDDDEPESEEEKDSNDDGEVELDASQLQNFLMESDDEEEMVLEHHAGADKALAKLIKIKQEARKAGQQARDREEMSDQLRCTLLLDVVLSNPGRQFDCLFTADFIEGMFLPLLTTRRKLEKALLSGTTMGKRSATGDSEKRALADKLGFLVVSKLCKLKVLSTITGAKLPELLGEIMNEVRKAASNEQIGCCSSAMIAVCKMLSSINKLDSISAPYVELVDEWATKRTTKLKTSIFADLAQQQKR